MDTAEIYKKLTSIADKELLESGEETAKLLTGDKKLNNFFEIQSEIHVNLRQEVIKHPLPYKIRKKADRLLHGKGKSRG